MKELDVSGNHCDTTHVGADGPGFAQMLAARIKDNGALSKLIFGGDKYVNGEEYVTPEPATLELGMTEVDLSKKSLKAAGAIIVAAWISHRDKGAMTSLNLASNKLGVEGAKIIAACLPKCT